VIRRLFCFVQVASRCLVLGVQHRVIMQQGYFIQSTSLPAPTDDAGVRLSRGVMLEKLQDASIAMLRAATAAMCTRNPRAGATSKSLGSAYLAYSGSEVPLTRAVGIGTSGPVTSSAMEEIESFYRFRNSPVRIAISARTDRSLPHTLEQRGYTSGGMTQNWYLPLGENRTIAPSPRVEVVPVQRNGVEQWINTVAAGFEEEGSEVEELALPAVMRDTFYCLGFAKGAQAFLALLNGQVAGGAVLHICGNVAYIRTASCRLQYRYQGVQTALLDARLKAARSAGCDLAFSSTDRLGVSARNLMRFGFKPLSESYLMTTPERHTF